MGSTNWLRHMRDGTVGTSGLICHHRDLLAVRPFRSTAGRMNLLAGGPCRHRLANGHWPGVESLSMCRNRIRVCADRAGPDAGEGRAESRVTCILCLYHFRGLKIIIQAHSKKQRLSNIMLSSALFEPFRELKPSLLPTESE